MRNILLGLSAALVLVPLLALAGLALGGVATLRPWVERTAARVLDRPFAIEGDLALAWSWRPTLRAEGLVIGAKPEEAGDLARIGRLELRLALLPLLVGRLEVDRLRLSDATVVLPADGARRADRGAGVGHATGTPRDRAPLPLRELLLERVRIEVPASGERPSRSLLLSRLEARLRTPEGPLELAAEGELDGQSATLELDLDSLQALLEGRPARVDLLAVELAGGDLEGTLAIDPGGPRPRLEGNLASRRLELATLAGLVAGPAVAEEGESPARGSSDVGGERDRRRGRVILDRPIDLAALRGVEVRVVLRVGELVTRTVSLHDLVLPVEIGNGRLVAAPITASFAGGRLGGRFEADGGQPQPAISLALEARAIAAAQLQRAFGQEPTIEAPLDLDLELAGRGHSLAALLGSADGRLTAASPGGRVRAPAPDAFTPGVRAAIATLAGAGDTGWVELRCFALDLPVRAGVGEVQTAVADTGRARLTAEGRVDLGSERLDLTLLPESRDITVAVPLRLRGRFVAPKIEVDRGEAARRAALGLLGRSVLPRAAAGAFADLGVGATPCLELKALPSAPTSPPPLAGSPPALDALRRGLDGLLGAPAR